MKYRRTRPADRIEIKELSEKYGIGYDGREPMLGFVAEEEDGKVAGASYVHKAAIIDPFFCPEPMAALKLFVATEGALSALDFNNIVIQVKASDKKLIGELRRFGFEAVEQRFLIFKKVF